MKYRVMRVDGKQGHTMYPLAAEVLCPDILSALAIAKMYLDHGYNVSIEAVS